MLETSREREVPEYTSLCLNPLFKRKAENMLNTNLGVVVLCAAMIVPAPSVMWAEKPQEAPAGPIPSQVLAAQKIFIANGGGSRVFGVGAPYNEFYADMKSWGHYQLVSSPSEADVVLEVGVIRPMSEAQIRLEWRDPKTNTLLWTIDEMLRGYNEKGVDEAVDKLIDDLKALTAPPAGK
jgi:hypothetical protein